MIGSLRLSLKQRFGHGFRVAWFRDVVRPRILQTEPIEAGDVSVCEIHVLTSETDWLNLVWALKTFYWTSGKSYGLCIHDDGTLSNDSRETLRRHFPAARMPRPIDTKQSVIEELADFPRCRAFRLSNHLSPKVFDFRHHLQADRMLLLDSDVLFFTSPHELLRRIEDSAYRNNSVNADVSSAYTVTPAEVKEKLGFELVERFNSGLGVIHRDSLRLDWIEEFLAFPSIEGHFWRIEQTLFALCSSRYGVELLPEEYAVCLKRQADERPVRHYVGAIRHLMYSEGIARVRLPLLARQSTS